MNHFTKYIIFILLILVCSLTQANISKSYIRESTSRNNIEIAEPDTIKPRYSVRRTSANNEEDLNPRSMDLRTPENLKTDTVYDEKSNTYTIGTKLSPEVSPQLLSMEHS